MEILRFRTSVSSILLMLFIMLPNKCTISLPLSEETTAAEDYQSEDSAHADITCSPNNPISKLMQHSFYSLECKSNNKEFWIRNCRCSTRPNEVNCPPPKCPQEMTVSTTAKAVLQTTTLLSSILLSPNGTASSGAVTTPRYSSITNVTAVSNTTNFNNNSNSSKPYGEELPTPSKLIAQSNTNFIRFG